MRIAHQISTYLVHHHSPSLQPLRGVYLFTILPMTYVSFLALLLLKVYLAIYAK